MPLVTAISPTVLPPNPATNDTHIPGGPNAKPNHVLFLDLSSRDSRPIEVPGPEDDPGFLLSVRDVVMKSRQPGNTPFDAIRIYCCSAIEPNPELWEALTDARPSHLEMSSGWDESCNYAGLSTIQPPWELKSLYLAAYEGNGSWQWDLEDASKQQPSFPACYAGLETLVLDYPGGFSLYFYPVGGATNLRSLTILDNDSVTVFARTVDCNPKLVETLRSVALGCVMPEEPASVRRMKKFFKEAKGLVNMELDFKKLYPDSYAESTESGRPYDEGAFATDPSAVVEVVPLSNPDDAEVDPSIPTTSHSTPALFSSELGAGENDDDIGHDEGNNDDVISEDGGEDDQSDYDDDELTYTGLPDVLPNTLESFSLTSPANDIILKELDEWVVRARDPSWLPNLRTIAFKVIPLNRRERRGAVYLTEKEKKDLEKKLEELLNIFRQRNPPVEVVEPRPFDGMRYPHVF